MFKGISRFFLFMTVLTLGESTAQVVNIGALPMTPNKLLAAVLLGIAALKFAIRPRRTPRHGKNFAVLAFAGAGITSLGMSFLQGIPIRDVVIGATAFYSVIAMYFVVVYLVEDSTDLATVCWGLALGAALIGLTSFLGVGRVQEGSWTRAGGIGGNPNLAATYCATGLSVAVLLFTENPRSTVRRAFIAGAMALALFGLLASLSRTGFLCLLAMSGFLIVRTGRLDVLRWGIPAALLLAIVFLFVAPEQYFDRIGTTGEEAGDLAAGNLQNRRILSWWAGLVAFAASPIVGVGRVSLGYWLWQHHREIGPITPHNSYIHVLATMGLVGFLPWITAVVMTWRDFSRVRRLSRHLRRLGNLELFSLERSALYLQASFLVWLLASMVSPFADDKGLWLLFALGTAVVNLARERAAVLARDEATSEPYQPSYGLSVAWDGGRRAD
jgi:O-antigen ligase